MEQNVANVAASGSAKWSIWNDPTPVDPNDASHGAESDVKGRLGVGWPWMDKK